VLVAATSGVSAIIGPNGRLQDRAEVFTAKTVVRRLPLADRHTPADRVGAAPEWLLTAVAVGALGAGLFGHRRGSA
jgi:apolipoprotein N-acyltransferase